MSAHFKILSCRVNGAENNKFVQSSCRSSSVSKRWACSHLEAFLLLLLGIVYYYRYIRICIFGLLKIHLINAAYAPAAGKECSYDMCNTNNNTCSYFVCVCLCARLLINASLFCAAKVLEPSGLYFLKLSLRLNELLRHCWRSRIGWTCSSFCRRSGNKNSKTAVCWLTCHCWFCCCCDGIVPVVDGRRCALACRLCDGIEYANTRKYCWTLHLIVEEARRNARIGNQWMSLYSHNTHMKMCIFVDAFACDQQGIEVQILWRDNRWLKGWQRWAVKAVFLKMYFQLYFVVVVTEKISKKSW